MTQPKVVEKKRYVHKLTHTDELYFVIQVPETFHIQHLDVSIQSEYWVLANKDISNTANYLLPINDPDKNTRAVYVAFRKNANYLSPSEIRDQRVRVGLNLRELAQILGFSYSTLSEIENNKRLQNQLQETALEIMLNKTQLYQLFKNRSHQLKQTMSKRQYDRVEVALIMATPKQK
ncbi:MAG: helix-turn-helix domain-containing protein [Schleiferilactobacillus perolens]|jgi:DNA-binding transcriptional regulator YiaG|uniref:helix-turn-helix domain-containing protein n=1 Tax=Schleiferilactobacillus perolens TaxID=100468 RepID=UPI0039EA4CE5